VQIGHIILFIDEIHNTLIGAGGGQGVQRKNIGCANIAKPALARRIKNLLGYKL